MPETFVRKIDRRRVLGAAAALGAAQVASPFLIHARGESPVRIGLVDPLTGVYAAGWAVCAIPALWVGISLLRPAAGRTRRSPVSEVGSG